MPYGHVEEEALRFDIQHRQKRPSLTWPQITPKLEAIIKRCWTESATERPTFEAVVPVLHDILQEELNATSEDGPDCPYTCLLPMCERDRPDLNHSRNNERYQ